MVTTFEQFIDALRNELQQYGEMLALLETQQCALHHRSTDAVAASASTLNSQSVEIDSARRLRENLQRQVAWALGVPEEQTVRQLIPLAPPEYQPLLTALAHEIQELLRRVRHCARENHEHLRRSLEQMEQFITKLSPPSGKDLLDGQESPPERDEPPLPGIAAAV
jgi:hypothetical protein